MRKSFTSFTLLLSGLFLFIPGGVSAADTEESLEALEAKLAKKGSLVLNGSSDKIKKEANSEFQKTLRKALKLEESFNYPFESIKNLSLLKSEDKKVKIYNWNLPFDDGTFQYFCFIQYKEKREVKTFELTDASEEIENPSQKTLDRNNWYGALYYDIIHEKKVGKNHYTLLAWDGNDRLTTKKIIEVLYFKKGEPKFGDYIFKEPRIKRKRVIFEYSSEVVMSLKYHKKRDQIVFDFLSPSRSDFEGIYEYYGPVLNRFDAFEVTKGHWKFIKDVDIKGEKRVNDKYHNEKPDQKEKIIYGE